MKIKDIAVKLSAKVPMQDFGSLDLEIQLIAEIAEDDDLDESMQALTDSCYDYLEQMLVPAVTNKLAYAAKLILNWPDREQDAYWSKFLEAENVKMIRSSGAIKPSRLFELIEESKETTMLELQTQDKQV